MKATPANMMEIVNMGEEDGRVALAIMAPWEQVADDYEDILEEYSRVGIAGFRAGKTPRYIVEKRFQREIMNEFSRRCGRRLGKQVLSQAGAEPMGPVELTDIECVRDKPFKFVVRFHPMPEIELPEIDSFNIGGNGTDPRDMISSRLLEEVSFEVPDELIRAELGSCVSDVNQKGIEWKSASDRVRLMLILKRIASREGIEVDEKDVEKRIEEKAAEFGASSDSLKTELEKGGGLQRLKDMLLAESTLNFLIEKSGGNRRS